MRNLNKRRSRFLNESKSHVEKMTLKKYLNTYFGTNDAEETYYLCDWQYEILEDVFDNNLTKFNNYFKKHFNDEIEFNWDYNPNKHGLNSPYEVTYNIGSFYCIDYMTDDEDIDYMTDD